MNEKIFNIFNGLVPKKTLDIILNDFESVAEINILELGVDSLAIMEVVFRIEECIGHEFDYDNFSIEQIQTLRLILNIINSKK